MFFISANVLRLFCYSASLEEAVSGSVDNCRSFDIMAEKRTSTSWYSVIPGKFPGGIVVGVGFFPVKYQVYFNYLAEARPSPSRARGGEGGEGVYSCEP